MSGLFHGTPLERPVTCAACEKPLDECRCPRNAAGQITPPHEQTATIRLEKRRRGKVVTTITGLDPVANDLPALARQLKQRCATGGTVEGGTLELQGDHRDAAVEALRAKGFTVKRS
jgi:translation initiation factor 1